MQNRGKEILLLVLALAALGVALFTFRGKPSPTAPPAEPTAAQGESEREVAAAPASGEPDRLTAAGAAPEGNRNPFAAPGTVPVAPEPGAEPSAAGPETAAPTTEPTPASDKALTLTGIVEGKPAVAIIRQEDQRYFVRAGDQVGDHYRVQAIGRHQVTLVGPEGKVILRMGGRQ